MNIKKIIVFILIFVIVFNFYTEPAYAIFGIDDYILCQALILAGVSITSGVVYTQVKDLIFKRISDEDKHILSNLSSYVKNGVLLWPLTMFAYLKSVVDGIFKPGLNDIAVDELNSPDIIPGYYSSITLDSGTYTWGLVYGGSRAEVYRNGVKIHTTGTIRSNNPIMRFYLGVDGEVVFYASGPYGILEYYIATKDAVVLKAVPYDTDTISIYCSDEVGDPNRNFISTYLQPGLTQEESNTYGKPITGIPDGVLDGSIPVTDAMNDLYGKTKEQIQDMPLPNVNYGNIDIPIPYPDTIPANPPINGTLDGISTQINSVVNTIKSIPLALAKFFDLTVPINLDPLTNIPSIISKKFPFSLPWDYMRGLNLLVNDGGFNKIITIDFLSTKLEIDFSVLDIPIGFLRIGELIIFDISLLFATRKLLGGAV